jgi:hypothetical protein
MDTVLVVETIVHFYSYCALHQGPEESGVDSKSTMMGSTCRDRQLQCTPKMRAYLCRSFQATAKSLTDIYQA